MTLPLILLGKFVAYISRLLNLGSGGTWPGEIALTFNPHILSSLSSKLKKGIIIVAGTNGKTTTTLMIRKILEGDGYKVLHNESGANLLNGVASAFIQNSSWFGRVDSDFGVFEIDESSLPLFLRHITPKVVVMLNLFRDQLDRYGEVDVIAEKWSKTLKDMPETTSIILNADDPQVAFLGKNLKARVIYFGVNNPKLYLPSLQHATDSIFCLNCGNRLNYTGIYYSHIGVWRCDKCGLRRPKPDISKWESNLPGLYNKYNTLAAVAAGSAVGIDRMSIKKSLDTFTPAFGRQEEFDISGKKIKIFLSKNPAGFNESLRTIISLGAKNILLVLNDRIPDGRDVSWIWDVDFEMIPDAVYIIISGDRVYDLALRMKYATKQLSNETTKQFIVEENLNRAIGEGLKNVKEGEILYILPTYSAMLEVRKILTGRKIL